MPHNILHICKVYLPTKGGIQNIVRSLTSRMQDHSNIILTTGRDGAVEQQLMDGATVKRCRSYLEVASMPIAPALLKKLIQDARKSDLVCLHYPFPMAEFAINSQLFSPPIVVHWHSNIVAQKKLKWLVAPFSYLTLLRAKAIIVTSEKMIDNSALLRHFSNKVRVIAYGIDDAPLPNTSDSNISSGSFVLVGRHVSYKGINIAIKAMQHVDAKLTIVGNGPLFEKHKLLAQELGVDQKITFQPNCTDQQVVEHIRASIGLIVPSIMPNEAFALVQLEAMRLGKPVINTNLPSTVPTVARHQQEGLTVEPSNAEALSQAMQTLLDKPGLAEELGHAGYERFKSKFTADDFVGAHRQLYQDIITAAQ